MSKDKELEQLLGDLNKITDLFKKMENASLDDVDSLKEESTLLQKELKERYGEENTTETDSPEA
jgi:Asp-tRNA(Asn)/Glu-tRNA(Gln) amidotransferase C subunit